MAISKPRAPSRMSRQSSSNLFEANSEDHNNTSAPSLRSKPSHDSGFFAKGAHPPSPAMSTHSVFDNGIVTPSALVNRLESMLVAKSNEIQLAGRLGEQLLAQQAELERRLVEAEGGSESNDHRQHNDGRVCYDSDDENAANGHLQTEEVKLKLEALEDDLKRWDEENEGFYQSIGQKGMGHSKSQAQVHDDVGVP